MASYPGVPVTVVSGSLGTISNGGASVAASSSGVITITLPLNQAATYLITDTVTTYDSLSTATGATATAVRTFTPPPVTVAGAAGVTYSNVTVAAGTLTLTGSTGVTALAGMGLEVARPTVTDTSAITVTTGSTVDIDSAPQATGSAGISQLFGLRVGAQTAGNTNFVNVAGGSYAAIAVPAHTIVLTTTTNTGATGGVGALRLDQITINQSGGAVTLGAVGTLDIVGAPIAGASVTLTNTYAIRVRAGLCLFSGGINVAAANIATDTTTGTIIATTAAQKLGFFAAAPIAQPNTVGTATGYTAGATAATFHSDDTYTGNTGATAYTINGIVNNLKRLGLLAS